MSLYKNFTGSTKPSQPANNPPAPTEETANTSEPHQEDEDLKALNHPSYHELEAQLNATEAKLNEALSTAEEYKKQALQSRADLDNGLKRAEKDIQNARKYGIERLANELLPVIDSLERGLSVEVNDNEFAQRLHQGLEMTLSLLLNTLEKFAVIAVNPLGEAFNPALHQAISTQEDTTVASNTVLNVLQKGYLLNERLIRPALVVVAK